MSEKSHIGMSRCFWCGEHSGVMFDTRLMNTLPQDCGVVDMVPCHTCRGHMDRGIILLGVDDEKSDMGSIERYRSDWMSDERNQGRPYIPGTHGEVYRSGHFHVVTEDFVRRFFKPQELVDSIIRHRWSFVQKEISEWLDEQSRLLAEDERDSDGNGDGA